MIDLNVSEALGTDGEPIPEYEPPRTDVLHYLSTRVNLAKNAYEPGKPNLFRLTFRRVRLFKTCEQWVNIYPSYDGGYEGGQCTGRASQLRIVTYQYDSFRSLACIDCMAEQLEDPSESFDLCDSYKFIPLGQ